MIFKSKGHQGYLRSQKLKYLIGSIIEFGVVFTLVYIGYRQTGSRLNLFTLFAVLICLPASKMLVELLVLLPHKSLKSYYCQEVKELAPLLTSYYDLILTSSSKKMQIDILVIYGNLICGYASSAKTSTSYCENYLADCLKKKGFEHLTVRVFHERSAFLSRVEGMQNMAQVEQPSDNERERAIGSVILSTSM